MDNLLSEQTIETNEKYAEMLTAMSHPLRLHMVHELVRKGTRNVKSFVDETGVSQPAVSQHLARLRNGGVVEMQKKGTNVYYSVEDPMVKKLINVMFKGKR